MTERLFEVEPLPQSEPMSSTRRRTLRQRQSIEAGVNPATGVAIRSGSETCGSCGHLEVVDWHTSRYFKCGLVEPTHGPSTDIRKWWPACMKWVPTRDSTGGVLIDELLS